MAQASTPMSAISSHALRACTASTHLVTPATSSACRWYRARRISVGHATRTWYFSLDSGRFPTCYSVFDLCDNRAVLTLPTLRGPGRKPDASSCLLIHAKAFFSHRARAKAWCLLIHAEASLSLSLTHSRPSGVRGSVCSFASTTCSRYTPSDMGSIIDSALSAAPACGTRGKAVRMRIEPMKSC